MGTNTEKDTKGAELLEECLKRYESETASRWFQRATKRRRWKYLRRIKNYFLIKYLSLLDKLK